MKFTTQDTKWKQKMKLFSTLHQYYNLQPTNNLNSTVFSSLILKTWPRRSWDPMQIFLYISFDSWPYTYHSPSAKQNSVANPNPWHCYDPITIPSRNRRKKVLRLVQMMISVPGNMRRKAWLNKTRRCLEVNHPSSSLLFSSQKSQECSTTVYAANDGNILPGNGVVLVVGHPCWNIQSLNGLRIKRVSPFNTRGEDNDSFQPKTFATSFTPQTFLVFKACTQNEKEIYFALLFFFNEWH